MKLIHILTEQLFGKVVRFTYYALDLTVYGCRGLLGIILLRIEIASEEYLIRTMLTSVNNRT